jgi:hypothetical protein
MSSRGKRSGLLARSPFTCYTEVELTAISKRSLTTLTTRPSAEDSGDHRVMVNKQEREVGLPWMKQQPSRRAGEIPRSISL